MSDRRPVIAIDGPAGAGKSTVSKILARELGFQYLDTGAMYRCLAYKAKQNGVSIEDAEAAASLLSETTISFGPGEPQRVILDGVDVTEAIRTPDIGDAASAISAHSPVRRGMVERQQALVAGGGVVLEGRDATTVIAPDAEVKVYMTASLEERAQRRLREFAEKGIQEGFSDVRSQILLRDHRDITREDSPLKVAEDAHLIETAGLTIEQVVAKLRTLIPS